MTNNYSNVFATSLLRVEADNQKRLAHCVIKLTDERVIALLDECNVNMQRFERNIYASEKIVKIAHNLTRDHLSVSTLEKNMFATMKTVLIALKASEKLTIQELAYVCINEKSDAKVKVRDDRKHLLFNRKTKISAAVQAQQCKDALLTLNVSREVASDVFEFSSNAIVTLFHNKCSDIAAL